MSEIIKTTLSAAAKYNAQKGASLGWQGQLPKAALEAFEGLKNEPHSLEFAEAVRLFQTSVWGASSPEVDGRLGRGTWTALLKAFDFISNEEAFWVVNQRRVNATNTEGVKFINFDQPGGLDLHRFGNFSSRRGIKPKVIVVHWGGLDPKHCYNIFSSSDRKVSSHAGVGLENGAPIVYQYLDLQHKSWHAGFVNSFSVGIDICQQPSIKWHKHYKDNGYNIEKMMNPTQRGPKNIISLDPNVALAAKVAIKTLCEVLDIPYQFPCGPEGKQYTGSTYHGVLDSDYLKNDFTGIIGHHHITNNKWDVACWWEDIIDSRNL